MSSEDSCALCGYREDLLRCSRCKLILYCSKEHQKKHWKKHKIDCEGSKEKTDSNKEAPKAAKTTATPKKSKKRAPSPITPPKTPVASQSPSTPSRSGGKSTAPGKSPLSTPGKSSGTLSEKSLSPGGSEFTPPRTPLPQYGSSEAEILNTGIENLCLSPTSLKFATQATLRSSPVEPMPITSANVVLPRRPQFQDYPESSIPPYLHKAYSEDMVNVVIEDLNAYGLCVLDNFCGPALGKEALQEVLNMYSRGIFQSGQLVSKSKTSDAQSIRSDKIHWVDGKEPYCRKIGMILTRIDNLIMKANKSPNNGKLGRYNINGRTKAMLAVYPGSGTHYVKHVDNPNNDGRCVTAIYYLNINWDVKTQGGLLRIFPEYEANTVADIAPLFDRLLFFWSDRQNPHEVQPSYDTRYAITLWYFDATERAMASRKFELENKLKELGEMRSSPDVGQLEIMAQVHQRRIMQNQQRFREEQNKAAEEQKEKESKKKQTPKS